MSKIAILEECLENEVALERCLCGAASCAVFPPIYPTTPNQDDDTHPPQLQPSPLPTDALQQITLNPKRLNSEPEALEPASVTGKLPGS